MIGARPPLKSRSVTSTLVTLQREPPLTRIFAPDCAPPRSTATRAAWSRAPREDRRCQPRGAARRSRRHRDRVRSLTLGPNA
jgi:hypothetical protein